MRYIGNKTKLLSFIGRVTDELGIGPGKAADPFAGTASVARYLKRRGFHVSCCDIMSYSYAFQRAYVQLDRLPGFQRVLNEDDELRTASSRRDFQKALNETSAEQIGLFQPDHESSNRPLRTMLLYLERFLPGLESFITREYSPAQADGATGPGPRMFFTPANACRIDAIRTRLEEWREAELLTDDEFFLLLACLLEAADAVANTTGVYAAFVKSWQPNALKPLRLREPELCMDTNLHCTANLGDANQFVRNLPPTDLVYLDPPYNTRQYSAYYHVPEIIAEGWFRSEPETRGKTGLIPDAHKKSDWSVRGKCGDALRDLVANLDARYLLLSYNSEGILSGDVVTEVFEDYGRPGTMRRHELEYPRYRSDRDGINRRYIADRVTEIIYSVELASGT